MPHTDSPTPSDTEAKQYELEMLAQAYFKHVKIGQEQSDAMAHDRKRMEAAHARVTAEILEEQKNAIPISMRSPAQLQADLEELARRCAVIPKSFDDRMRILFAAQSHGLVLIDYLSAPDRPMEERMTILKRGAELLDQHNTSHQVTQGIVKLTPDHPITRPVTEHDISCWCCHPEELVGCGFITREQVPRIFVVDDFSIKQRKGPQYDVIYEDSGLDNIFTFNSEELLELVTETELVTNM